MDSSIETAANNPRQSEAVCPLWPDVTYMHEILGRTKVHWRDGFRKMIEARRPELRRAGKDAGK